MRPVHAVFVVLALARAAQAQSDTTDLARRHYQSASAYYEEQRWDEAVREFRESYRLAPRVALLFNIAKCYEKKGDVARAIDALRDYLRMNAAAADRVAIEAEIARFAETVGRVRVEGAPTGAEILIDDAAVGQAPLASPVSATAGKRRVEARTSDGSAPLSVEVTVPAHGEVTAQIPARRRDVVVKERVVMVAPTWYRSRAAWALIGSGALVAVAGAVSAGLSRSVQDGAGPSEQEWRDAQSRASGLQDAGIALIAVGAAAAIAGVAVFVVRARADRPAAAAAWIAPGGGGLVAGGRF